MAPNNHRGETPENGVHRRLAVLQEDRDEARLVAGETNHRKVGGLQTNGYQITGGKKSTKFCKRRNAATPKVETMAWQDLSKPEGRFVAVYSCRAALD